jgi:hypothetical protein
MEVLAIEEKTIGDILPVFKTLYMPKSWQKNSWETHWSREAFARSKERMSHFCKTYPQHPCNKQDIQYEAKRRVQMLVKHEGIPKQWGNFKQSTTKDYRNSTEEPLTLEILRNKD